MSFGCQVIKALLISDRLLVILVDSGFNTKKMPRGARELVCLGRAAVLTSQLKKYGILN